MFSHTVLVELSIVLKGVQPSKAQCLIFNLQMPGEISKQNSATGRVLLKEV